MKGPEKFSLFALIVALAGCASQHFTANSNLRPARPPDCEIQILSQAPTAGTFEELGICDVAVPGGGLVADFSHKATRKLRECACAAGGNAVVPLDSGEQNVLGSQQRVKAKGSILWVQR
jgi:hypothetical protein